MSLQPVCCVHTFHTVLSHTIYEGCPCEIGPGHLCYCLRLVVVQASDRDRTPMLCDRLHFGVLACRHSLYITDQLKCRLLARLQWRPFYLAVGGVAGMPACVPLSSVPSRGLSVTTKPGFLACQTRVSCVSQWLVKELFVVCVIKMYQANSESSAAARWRPLQVAT